MTIRLNVLAVKRLKDKEARDDLDRPRIPRFPLGDEIMGKQTHFRGHRAGSREPARSNRVKGDDEKAWPSSGKVSRGKSTDETTRGNGYRKLAHASPAPSDMESRREDARRILAELLARQAAAPGHRETRTRRAA